MIVKWINKKSNSKTTITSVITSINWSGSTSQVARTLTINVLHAPSDLNITDLRLSIATGDIIALYDDDELLFYGEIQSIDKPSETGSVTYNATDLLAHLLRSTGCYNFKDTTPEKITRTICNEFQIETDSIEETKVPIKKLIIDSECIYDIIMKAYTKAAKHTGKKYIVKMLGKKFSVIEKGSLVKNFVLSEKTNITNVSYQETIENMVNVVKIYDDIGKQVGEVKKEDWVGRYGIYQETYKKESGVNPRTAADNMLSGIEKKVSIDAIDGDLNCIAGNGVMVYDAATKLNGLFWIDSDSHTWENGNHTMSLELNFKNIMDSRE